MKNLKTLVGSVVALVVGTILAFLVQKSPIPIDQNAVKDVQNTLTKTILNQRKTNEITNIDTNINEKKLENKQHSSDQKKDASTNDVVKTNELSNILPKATTYYIKNNYSYKGFCGSLGLKNCNAVKNGFMIYQCDENDVCHCVDNIDGGGNVVIAKPTIPRTKCSKQ